MIARCPHPRAVVMLLPLEAQPLLHALAPAFTNPTYHRFATLAAAAILTTGRRTVANVLRTVGDLAPGHPASYRRVLSSAEWPGLELGCALTRVLLTHVVPDRPVDLVGDDTVDGHPGAKVYGKGRHRDAVRSSHSYTAWRYGHKWVVLAVRVRFPFATRRWALPVLVDLYRTPEVSKAEGVRHRTPAQLRCRLLRLVLPRFPDRTFVFAGDSGYGTHAVARFCCRHRRRLSLVGKLHPDANLFEPPPAYAGKGRPRVRGRALPKPRAAAATARLRKLTVAWYGGGTRRVEAATGTGHWYKGGAGLVPIRWVFVKDTTGTHRDAVIGDMAEKFTRLDDTRLNLADWRLAYQLLRDLREDGFKIPTGRLADLAFRANRVKESIALWEELGTGFEREDRYHEAKAQVEPFPQRIRHLKHLERWDDIIQWWQAGGAQSREAARYHGEVVEACCKAKRFDLAVATVGVDAREDTILLVLDAILKDQAAAVTEPVRQSLCSLVTAAVREQRWSEAIELTSRKGIEAYAQRHKLPWKRLAERLPQDLLPLQAEFVARLAESDALLEAQTDSQQKVSDALKEGRRRGSWWEMCSVRRSFERGGDFTRAGGRDV